MRNHFVKSAAELPDLSAAKTIILDYETDSGDPKRPAVAPWEGARIAFIGISDGTELWTIATDRCKRGPNRLPWESVKPWLQTTLAAPRDKFVGQWIRTEVQLSRADGCPMNRAAIWYDTEIAAHHWHDTLLRFNLNALSEVLLRENDTLLLEDELLIWLRDARLGGTQKKPGNYAEAPSDMLSRYCGQDVITTWKVQQKLESLLQIDQRIALAQDLEFNKLLCDMAYTGLRIDREKLLFLYVLLRVDLSQMGETFSRVLKYEFNPNSNPQVKELLIDTWHLPVLRWNQDTDICRPSFDDDALELYQQLKVLDDAPFMRAVIQLIDAYRDRNKTLSTVENILVASGADGRLHGEIHPCRCHGGRSSATMHVQQLPKVLKWLIIPEEGHGFFNADASQVEYRWMAHYMKDPRLLEGYKSREFDLHKYVQDWLKIERRAAKVFNFGVGFNMGAERLSREYSAVSKGAVSLDEGRAILKRYYNEIVPLLLPTRRDVENVAKSRGYVKNFFGRRSHLTALNAYRGFNRVVQGSAADYAKNRALAVEARIRNEGWQDLLTWLLFVHDEYLWDLPLDPGISSPIMVVAMEELEAFDLARLPMYWEGAWSAGSWGLVAEIKDDKTVQGRPLLPGKSATVKTKLPTLAFPG